jgi:sulfur relay (sulfurtransferase) complex TusBCD TusD component (DsrE family)
VAKYLLVDNRDLHEHARGKYLLNVASGLKNKGHEVTLFLVENGVLAAGSDSAIGKSLTALSKGGIKILAEDASLKRRGIERVGEGITVSNMDELADLIINQIERVIWY